MIKVRCWDKKRKRWAKPHRDIYAGFQDTDRYTWQRFFTDTANGQGDVFEGDVVDFHYFYDGGGIELEKEIRGIVRWQDHYHYSGGAQGCFTFEVLSFSDFQMLSWSDDIVDKDDMQPIPFYELFSHECSFTVVGNIFENSELLAPQKAD